MLDLSTLPEAPSSTTLGVPGARWAKLRDRSAAPSVCDLMEDDHAALLAVAAGLSNWHRSVRFCAKCGGNSVLRIGDLAFVVSSQMSVVFNDLCGFKRTYYFAF